MTGRRAPDRAHDRRPGRLPAGLESVAARSLLRPGPLVWLPLTPGDRPLVVAGESVLAGATLAACVRGASTVEVAAGAVPADARPGAWLEDERGSRGGRRARADDNGGELLYRSDGAWRVVTGERTELLEAPAAGIVREVRPGSGIALAIAGAGVPGVLAIGGPARGRLEILGDSDGELRPGSLDVGRAGSIVVVGSRIDAETLTRARAMGIRGVVVAAISSRDVRDIAASEARQRASLQPLSPFAILVLEGHVRRPIPDPLAAILGALAGRDVAIVGDPPLLLFDQPDAPLPRPTPDRVRVRYGPAAGREGRWIGLAGRRRFGAGVQLEAGLVEIGDGRPRAVPLADLERFV